MRPARLVDAAFGAALTGGLLAAFAPFGQRCEAIAQTAREPIGPEVCRAVSIFQVDGAWVLVVVSVPILVALAPVLLRRRPVRVTAAMLLWIGCVVGMFSVGLFFVPAAILMTVAAAIRDPIPASAVPT
jgi:hypothetical protein